MKICLACSAGGHLTEMLQIKDAVKGHDVFFLTYEAENSRDLGYRTHFVENVTRNPITLLKNAVQTLRVLLRERPGLIISTGAGVAVPACYLGKLLGSRVVFIETFCMPTRGSLSGRFAYPVADRFLLQWREQSKNYGKKAEYVGSVF